MEGITLYIPEYHEIIETTMTDLVKTINDFSKSKDKAGIAILLHNEPEDKYAIFFDVENSKNYNFEDIKSMNITNSIWL